MFRVYVNLPEGICNDQTIIYHLHKYMIMLNDSNIQSIDPIHRSSKKNRESSRIPKSQPRWPGEDRPFKKTPQLAGKKMDFANITGWWLSHPSEKY